MRETGDGKVGTQEELKGTVRALSEGGANWQDFLMPRVLSLM